MQFFIQIIIIIILQKITLQKKKKTLKNQKKKIQKNATIPNWRLIAKPSLFIRSSQKRY